MESPNPTRYATSSAHDDRVVRSKTPYTSLIVKRWDSGSLITVIGLASNLCLAILKGVAGAYTNSTFLLADAGHSLGDLLGDMITFVTWNWSHRSNRKAQIKRDDKLEAMGTLFLSLMIVGGGLGIGTQAYQSTVVFATPDLIVLPSFSGLSSNIINHKQNSHRHSVHTSGRDDMLNPSAAWFAVISILVKEVLYRVTKRVADEEKSPLLTANALHHRSDACTSGIVLISIWGSIAGAPILDPLGGLIISLVVIKQGVCLCLTAVGNLLSITDD